MRSSIGNTLIVLGAVAIVIGLIAKTGAFAWFGRLPGDVRIERTNVRMYVPIVSMLLVSLVLSAIAALIRRWR